MLERKVRHQGAIGQAHLASDGLQLERRKYGEQQFGEQVVANCVQLGGLAMDGHATQGTLAQHVEDEREPHDVVEVRMGEIDVERVGCQMLADAVQSGAGVERHAQFGNQHTRRLTAVVRMIAGGAEQNDLHAIETDPG